jgi:putative nucleotidyltransferase with HDIG domain
LTKTNKPVLLRAVDNVSELLEEVDALPASPALLPKLAQAMRDINNTNVHEVVDVIMFDSSLTAKLLQIANSAYFGNATPLTNVGDAISQVGYDTVYLLAASIAGESCLRLAPGTGLNAVLLWKHSVTTAFGAQHVAQAAELDGNLSFTAGLLHDLGKVVFAGIYGKDYVRMFDPAQRGSRSLIEWENAQYGCDHAELGAALLERWKLPATIVAAVRFHHRPAAAGENAPLAACIRLGNILSRAMELPSFSLDPASPELQPALQLLNLTVADRGEQWNRIHQNWEFVQKLCDLRK